MKIELTSQDNDKYLRSVEVYDLSFDTQEKTFSMTYCDGDCWGLVMQCPIATAPTRVQFQGIQAAIQFERKQDADEFGEWLIEGDKKVRHGFTTMRG
jgi:hypothetical protein